MAPQGQVVGYVRVSSEQQNLARQLESIGEVDRFFQDKVSGGSRSARVGLAECLRYIRDGDTVRVASMDRLARSLVDLQQIVDEILQKGASVQFVKEGQTYSPSTDDSMSRLLLQILGAFAEFQRNLIRERQAEGIAIAKANGRYKGRAQSLSPAQIESAKELNAQGIPKTRIAREFGVNRSTLYRALKKHP
ncbi:DNA invertase Pin-like site-specific DNA recombinase [Luteococcus japonicus]|uniref:DNA invertase Pin-like site-specific DNA recombinase n=1 Tax=Luteococcus japonicus TaxID=33984 RepID=A0A3N1ZR58_9ACTN|nr:recombinase family protein [Luteococcus japonicus]ROR53346.1 DNA invertase Pin-like site-specific DNA recombinase [Luteococcus japonicus]